MQVRETDPEQGKWIRERDNPTQYAGLALFLIASFS
jgi:hypothetical protein